MSNFLEKIEVKDRFTSIFKGVHNIQSDERAKDLFEVEKFHFMKLISENPKLGECTQNSTIGTFLDVVSNGLSFEKAQGHVYVMGRNVKTGKKDSAGKDIYEQRMSYEIAKNGVMRMVKRAGSVKDIVDPVIVYKGDEIKVNTTESGMKHIIHSPAIPRTSNEILGAYCFVITPDNRRDGFWYSIENIDRLKTYSAKQNKYYDKDKKALVEKGPNELYSSGNDGQIDEGFFLTKVVKAALKNYSKQPLGINRVDDGAYVDENTNVLSDAELADKYMNDIPNDDVESTNDFTDFDEIPQEAF